LPPDIRPQVKLLPVLYKKDLEIVKDIQKEAQELNNKVKLLPTTQQVKIKKEEVTFKLNCGKLSSNVAISQNTKLILKERIKNAKIGKAITRYIGNIKDNARQLKIISRRELGIARESERVRKESELFGTRITETIRNTIRNTIEKFRDDFTTTIKSRIKKFGERIKKRIGNYLKAKPKELTDEEKIEIINYLIKEAFEYSEKQFFLTEYQIKKRVIREAKEKFGIDEKFTNAYLFKEDIYKIANLYEIANLDIKIKGLLNKN
jgi:hypothetical protein